MKDWPRSVTLPSGTKSGSIAGACPLALTMGAWQTKLSKIMHWSFYVLLVLQPIFGILQAMYITEYEVVAFGQIAYSSMAADNEQMARIFHVAHGVNGKLLTVLVLGHFGAALYHHFWQKDNVLRRMLPFGKVSAD